MVGDDFVVDEYVVVVVDEVIEYGDENVGYW